MIVKYNITVPGNKHLKRGQLCQDYSCIKEARDGEAKIVGESDGVNAAEFAAYGARVAVEASINKIKELIEANENWRDEGIEIMRKGFEAASASILELASDNHVSEGLFSCTLTVVVYDCVKNQIWIAHIGDCGAIGLFTDGRYELLTTRHKGEEDNHVMTLRHRELWEFKHYENVASVVAMTDGILDIVCERCIGDMIYWPTLEPFMTDPAETEEEVEQERMDWKSCLANDDEFRRRANDDDLTIAVVRDTKLIEGMVNKPVFDEEAWNKAIDDYNATYTNYCAGNRGKGWIGTSGNG